MKQCEGCTLVADTTPNYSCRWPYCRSIAEYRATHKYIGDDGKLHSTVQHLCRRHAARWDAKHRPPEQLTMI